MSFVYDKGGWRCQFLGEGSKTPLPKQLIFQDPDKIMELAKRGGAAMNLEGRQAIENALRSGRGGVYLNLTGEQYARLCSGDSREKKDIRRREF